MTDDGARISRVAGRRVLNSHHEWTLELSVWLADGRSGRGAAPRGETPSIYEKGEGPDPDLSFVVDGLRRELVGRDHSQASLDAWIQGTQNTWGKVAGYALSTAFFEARRQRVDAQNTPRLLWAPRILFNLINGGPHAYTNPVVSDFTEYLLVPYGDLPGSLDAYVRLLRVVATRLSTMPTRIVGGNVVRSVGGEFGTDPNRAVCKFVLDLLSAEGLSDQFGLMIDASAGDWLVDNRYRLSASGIEMDSATLVEYWLDLIQQFPIAMLEDPFAETDVAGWQGLHRRRPATCLVLGDNLTSTDPGRLHANSPLVDGVVLKPDQNGTVTGTTQFAELAATVGLRRIASHRSIETDSVFLIHLAAMLNLDDIKIGPFSDFSAVLRTNELLRTIAQ